MTEPIACQSCGIVNEQATRQVEQLRDDLDRADREIGVKSREIRRLKREQAQGAERHPCYDPAMRVLEEWRRLCAPRTRELNGPRLAKVIDRLGHGYSEEELVKAVIGYSRYPYVVEGKRCAVGPADKRYVDAELIFRDAKHVDAGIVLAERDGAGPANLRGPDGGPLPASVMATLDWREVKRANWKLLKAELTKLFGEPLEDSDGIVTRWLFPCPRCQPPDVPDPETVHALPLTLNEPDFGPTLASCCWCGITERELLRALRDPVGLAVV